MNALFRLKKLAGRRSWTSNLSGAEPASWQVKGADIFLIGYSGAVPYYRLIVGGKFNGMEVEGGQDIRTLYSFADAKKAAKKAYLEQQSSTAEHESLMARALDLITKANDVRLSDDERKRALRQAADLTERARQSVGGAK
jgi:hypothetical protein